MAREGEESPAGEAGGQAVEREERGEHCERMENQADAVGHRPTPGHGPEPWKSPPAGINRMGATPLPRADNAAAPRRPFWAEPGAKKGGSLPSQYSVPDWPSLPIGKTTRRLFPQIRCAAVKHAGIGP